MPLIIDDPVNKRPENPVYVKSDIPGLEPDLVIDNIAQYLCWRNYNSKTTNCWKICRVSEVYTGAGTETRLQYPWGCDGYNFNPFHIYSYEGYGDPMADVFEYKR